ncbi:hypothetical protein ACO11K_003727 [Bacillus cytotoxicus]|uniref:hypothetical protein n=1 Tax=Bacillus cereus group sp. BfR-BA-01492 TaxID=2920361 RepID=UPI001F5AA06A|nr:hypothetical protein [Bacillus cereus group sp. BfR-BA-01492]EMA6344384.1 hypothetical protein [Bacillus cytotoxicus]
MTHIEVIYVELPELIESKLLHNSLSLLSSNERDLDDRCLPKRKIEFLKTRQSYVLFFDFMIAKTNVIIEIMMHESDK